MQTPSARPQRKPYPMPDHLEPSRRRARILQNCYSGRQSEMTAVAQYIYHHVEIAPRHPETARTLRSIAVVEMHHMDLLGECIRMLGGAPRLVYHYGDSQGYWHAGFIRYGRSVREMLAADRRGEEESIALYTRAIRLIGEPNIERLLERIIEDEREHITVLDELIAELE